uniref:Uncharacterized protein n=1 Tax=Anopheles christyi TaxID=43041 RepID=A0A182KHH8_9DIPT
MATRSLCRKGNLTLLVVFVLCWNICLTFVIPEPDEKCEWLYACCKLDKVNGECQTLCPTPTIVCPAEDEGTGTRDPARIQATKVLVTAPCKEGFRRDHTDRCRKIFEEPVYF